jgi:hypothetical protein
MMRELQRKLYDADELVAWRAVEEIGRAASGLPLEAAREFLRRTLWLMNDESGGVLWNGPQVIGAVLAHVPSLCAEFGPILASFLEEEPFRAGTRWALWRVSSIAPELVRDAGLSLDDPDPLLRGLAALALGAPVTADFVTFDFATGELRTFDAR